MILIKNIYEKPEANDGFRILIENTLPSEISKESLKLNLWMKDIAPSNDLKEWYDDNPDKWVEFENKYLNELNSKGELIKQLKIIEKFNKIITIIHTSKDHEHNHAIILKEFLQKPIKQIITSVGRIHGS